MFSNNKVLPCFLPPWQEGGGYTAIFTLYIDVSGNFHNNVLTAGSITQYLEYFIKILQYTNYFFLPEKFDNEGYYTKAGIFKLLKNITAQ